MTMSLSSLLPVLTQPLLPLARQAGDALRELSFFDVLNEPEASRQHIQAADESNTDEAADQAEFFAVLRDRFRSHGIDVAMPVRLKQDGHGNVVVDGDHPDRVVIEGLFAADAELTNEFIAISASATAVHASNARRNHFEEFRLVIDQTGMTIEFE